MRKQQTAARFEHICVSSDGVEWMLFVENPWRRIFCGKSNGSFDLWIIRQYSQSASAIENGFCWSVARFRLLTQTGKQNVVVFISMAIPLIASTARGALPIVHAKKGDLQINKCTIAVQVACSAAQMPRQRLSVCECVVHRPSSDDRLHIRSIKIA